MSLRPKSICIHAGCQRTIDQPSYCELHKKIAELREASRKNNYKSEHSSLYNWDWRKYRARYIKENPLCVHCLAKGKLTPTQEIDHIKPHQGDKNLFWLEDNLQALCKSCHSTKTALEDGGFGKKIKINL